MTIIHKTPFYTVKENQDSYQIINSRYDVTELKGEAAETFRKEVDDIRRRFNRIPSQELIIDSLCIYAEGEFNG